MMAFLRILFWLSASYNFRITAKYLPGKDNRLADCASRLHEPQMMLQWGHLLSISKPLACLDVLSFMSLGACMFLLNWFRLQSTQIFTSSHFRNTSGAIPRRPRIQESHVCRQHQSFVSHSSEEVYWILHPNPYCSCPHFTGSPMFICSLFGTVIKTF